MQPIILVRRIVYVLVDILVLLLLGVFFLRLFSANPSAPFVSWLYGISMPFLSPFARMFPGTDVSGLRVEWSVLAAIIVYGLVGYVIGRLLSLLLPRRTVIRRDDAGIERTEDDE